MITKKELRDFASLSCQIQNSKILLHSLQQNTPTTDDVHASDLLGIQPLIADIESKLSQLHEAYKKLLPAVEEIISFAPDPILRTALRLHYIRGLEWKEAAAIMGSSANALKAMSYRFLNSLHIAP